jgi:hypothetical protein
MHQPLLPRRISAGRVVPTRRERLSAALFAFGSLLILVLTLSQPGALLSRGLLATAALAVAAGLPIRYGLRARSHALLATVVLGVLALFFALSALGRGPLA